jgi:hypothetical protein
MKAMSDKIRSYAELRELIRASLRIQNPQWIEPNGDSPVCDFYEARFAELIRLANPREKHRRPVCRFDRLSSASSIGGTSAGTGIHSRPSCA